MAESAWSDPVDEDTLDIHTGTGTGTFTFTGAAVGKKTPKGAGTGTFTYAGVAVGKYLAKGSRTSIWNFTTAAVGKKTAKGTAQGNLIWSASGAGPRISPWSAPEEAMTEPASGGSATGTWTFTKTASVGTNVSAILSAWSGPVQATTSGDTGQGLGGGVFTFTATSRAGRRTPKGAGTGSLGYAGTAAGSSTILFSPWSLPADADTGSPTTVGGQIPANIPFQLEGFTPLPEGAAIGAFTFTNTSRVGKRVPKGSRAGTWTWVGAATGLKNANTPAQGLWRWTGVATGVAPASPQPPNGVGLGSVAYVATAIGKKVPKGSRSGTWLFSAGTTLGYTLRKGRVAGQHVWISEAIGFRPIPGLQDGFALGILNWHSYAEGMTTHILVQRRVVATRQAPRYSASLKQRSLTASTSDNRST